MTDIDVKEMLEAGVHFGHKKDKWNPKMRPFIYTEREGVHIFNLMMTADLLCDAQKFAANTSKAGGTILFVGTKKQTQEVIREAAKNAGMPYMTERWLGGTLTNFATILSRLKYLKETEEKTEKNEGMTKKERLYLDRELQKLNAVFEGVKELRKLPDALFVADVVKEKNAVSEAKKVDVPIIGIVDSNADPSKIDFPIAANDDAVRSVKYIAEKIAVAIAQNKVQAGEEESSASLKEPKQAKEDLKEVTSVEAISHKDLDKIEMKLEEENVVKKSRIADEKPAEIGKKESPDAKSGSRLS